MHKHLSCQETFSSRGIVDSKGIMSEYAEFGLIMSLAMLDDVSAFEALAIIIPINLLYLDVFIGATPIK